MCNLLDGLVSYITAEHRAAEPAYITAEHCAAEHHTGHSGALHKAQRRSTTQSSEPTHDSSAQST